MMYHTDMPIDWAMSWMDVDDDELTPDERAAMDFWTDEADALMLALGDDFGMSEDDAYRLGNPQINDLFAYAQEWDATVQRQRTYRRQHAAALRRSLARLAAPVPLNEKVITC